MVFCSQCGSSSRDALGFCRGCGAPISTAEPATLGQPANASKAATESAKRQSLVPPIFPVDRVTRKNVRLAITLAMFFGPLGMLYSTWVGALVMTCVYMLVRSFLGPFFAWFTWPVCMLWAGIAAFE